MLGMALTHGCGLFLQWPCWAPLTAKFSILCRFCSNNLKFIFMDLWHDTAFLNTHRIWPSTCFEFVVSQWAGKSHTGSQIQDTWLSWSLFCLQQNRILYNEEILLPFDFENSGLKLKDAKAPLCSFFTFFSQTV